MDNNLKMNAWRWMLLFLAQELLVELVRSQTCSPIPTELPEPVLSGTLMKKHAVSHLKGFKLLRCVMECFLLKLCVSFNYNEQWRLCTLNNSTASEVPQSSMKDWPEYVYHELQAWSDAIAGTCSDKPCAENQRCIQTTPYTCADVDCGPLHRTFTSGAAPYEFVAKTSPSTTSLGSEAVFSCNDDWVQDWTMVTAEAPFMSGRRSVCSSDYRWSPVEVGCSSKIRSCAKVKECNPSYGDGHYFIESANAEHSVLYCHGMSGTPKAYITLLPYENWSNSTGSIHTDLSTTIFTKVGIDVSNNILDITDVFVGDTQTVGEAAYGTTFGTAASCYDTIGGARFARFQIDLTGTGFMMKSATWVIQPTNFQAQSLDQTDTTASGQCGGTNCGYCSPDGFITPLKWQYNPTKAADGSEAIVPTCV